jgi:hypothetical protein
MFLTYFKIRKFEIRYGLYINNMVQKNLIWNACFDNIYKMNGTSDIFEQWIIKMS